MIMSPMQNITTDFHNSMKTYRTKNQITIVNLFYTLETFLKGKFQDTVKIKAALACLKLRRGSTFLLMVFLCLLPSPRAVTRKEN